MFKISELVKPFNFARYGLTADWSQTLLNTGLKGGKIVGGSRDAAPFTGELLASLSYIVGITLVIAISAGLCIWGRKKRKN